MPFLNSNFFQKSIRCGCYSTLFAASQCCMLVATHAFQCTRQRTCTVQRAVIIHGTHLKRHLCRLIWRGGSVLNINFYICDSFAHGGDWRNLDDLCCAHVQNVVNFLSVWCCPRAVKQSERTAVNLPCTNFPNHGFLVCGFLVFFVVCWG